MTLLITYFDITDNFYILKSTIMYIVFSVVNIDLIQIIRYKNLI